MRPEALELAVWRYYNGRADCENVIKELREGFALPPLCLEKFWATEAALSLTVLTCNLTVLFQRHLGWQQKVTIHSLRFWLFVTAGVLSHPGGKTTVKLAVPPHERGWWRRLWGGNPQSVTQLQFSRKPTRVHRLNRMKNHAPTAYVRLRASKVSWPRQLAAARCHCSKKGAQSGMDYALFATSKYVRQRADFQIEIPSEIYPQPALA